MRIYLYLLTFISSVFSQNQFDIKTADYDFTKYYYSITFISISDGETFSPEIKIDNTKYFAKSYRIGLYNKAYSENKDSEEYSFSIFIEKRLHSVYQTRTIESYTIDFTDFANKFKIDSNFLNGEFLSWESKSSFLIEINSQKYIIELLDNKVVRIKKSVA